MTLNLGDIKVKELYYGNTKVSGDGNYDVIETLYDSSVTSSISPISNSKILSGKKGILITLDESTSVPAEISTYLNRNIKFKTADLLMSPSNKIFIPKYMALNSITITRPSKNNVSYNLENPICTDDSEIKYISMVKETNPGTPSYGSLQWTSSASTMKAFTITGAYYGYTLLDSTKTVIYSTYYSSNKLFPAMQIEKIELV